MTVIDTHIWLWWASQPDRLSEAATESIRSAAEIGVCAISCWELAMLVEKGRIEMDRAPLIWIKQALALPRVVLLPLTPSVAVRSASLGADFPGDPADRMIAASALEHGAVLVTRDRRLTALSSLRTVW